MKRVELEEERRFSGEFSVNGFAALERVLTEAHLDELRAECSRLLADRLGGGSPRPLSFRDLAGGADRHLFQGVNVGWASPAFRRLARAPALTRPAARLLGVERLRLVHDQLQIKPARCGGINAWHQDRPYWDFLDDDRQVTAWVALDDATRASGCLWMVRGSHRWGPREDVLAAVRGPDGLPASCDGHPVEAVPCPVRAGGAHFHHAFTWHGSRRNRSPGTRRAIAFHYTAADTPLRRGGSHPLAVLADRAATRELPEELFPLVLP